MWLVDYTRCGDWRDRDLGRRCPGFVEFDGASGGDE
jgi:hypothetical protein